MYKTILKQKNFKLSTAFTNFKYFSSVAKYPFITLLDTLQIQDAELTKAKDKAQQNLHILEKLKEVCSQGGGEKGQHLHVVKNKKILPREKLKYIFDENSETFELCLLAGLGMDYGDIPGGSVVCVVGRVFDRYCLVTVNDGTLKGGTFFPITVKKSLRAQEISQINLLPHIYIVDSGGGFLPLQADSDFFADKNHGGRGFYHQAVNSSNGIPQLALVCGSCTAGGAYVPMMSDNSGIVDKIGTIFLGGPPLVRAATGEVISAEDLGGATVHCSESGCSDYFVSTEEEGFDMLRDVIATLDISPEDSRKEIQPLYNINDLDIASGLEKINRQRLMGIISRLTDGSRFREFKHLYGQNLVTGYAFIDQICVGIVANCGPLTYKDGLKGSHFIQNSGPRDEFAAFLDESTADENMMTLRGRASMISALSTADVPKITLNIGGCLGDDNYTMCGPSFQPNFIFSWPGTETDLNLQMNSRESNSQSKSEKKKSLSLFDFPPESSWFMSSHALNDGIITPSESRKALSLCLRIFEQKRRINCKKVSTPLMRF
ncbi:putative methylcrotonoyl-CoA carboxylase beta chain, mitochondrial [Armadillidium nasatum]|uniref:methylcrotonoyl-CoA carboxylase n=1 Tax=Armadillidium nasatum TaxID=96803 RepID=A0A5N5T9A1_9CRUS|nr:putative methylcrotonoyl-CoA carboxylase beta chain, mitochondrial [Armadillidium nasatum]